MFRSFGDLSARQTWKSERTYVSVLAREVEVRSEGGIVAARLDTHHQFGAAHARTHHNLHLNAVLLSNLCAQTQFFGGESLCTFCSRAKKTKCM